MPKYFFITRREHNVEETSHLKIVDSLDIFHEMMKNSDFNGLDSENTDLNQFYATPLLLQVATEEVSCIIDQTSVHEDYLSPYKKRLFVGQNIQYDVRIVAWHNKIELLNVEDTMCTDQILGRGSERFNNLEDLYFRRVGRQLPISKTTRNDFRTMSFKSKMENDHIIYSGFDPIACLEIRKVQEPIVKRYNLEHRVYYISNGCIPVLAEMNLNGFSLDKEKWKINLEENKKKRFEIECELDNIIIGFSKDYIKLRGGKWTRKRRRKDLEQFSLFDQSETVFNSNDGNISYNSTLQLTKLFNILSEPLPEIEDKDAEWGVKAMKVSFGEPALEQYKILYPSSRMTSFINILLKYKDVEKEINSFGETFLKERVKRGKGKGKYERGNYCSKTDKVHTIYKQEFTKNGRLSSGEKVNKKPIGFFNSQNMKKVNRLRNCFTLSQEEIKEGWLISTDDLTSAELLILADLSGDEKLIEHHDKDLHSYLATGGYTKVVKYITTKMNANRAYDEIWNLCKVNRLDESLMKKIDENTYIQYTEEEKRQIVKERVQKVLDTKEFIINKKEFPDIRNPFKNCVYGILYGATEDKIAKTLNIAPYYSELILSGMRDSLPVAFAYMDKAAAFGVKNGYIEYCKRTHSRHWFKSWIEANQRGRYLTGSERGSIERLCKNIIMSGAQADMIKEAMVTVNHYVKENNIAFKWLFQVHDELVYAHKDPNLRIGVIEPMISDVCNSYLTNLKMKVSGYTGTFWNKED